ncbi:MAG TPA: alcohol acetyltransferase [Candidatus Avipropionibacterium avicola]|uniref:Alcohol acetyltransferase n=1 Tax=Candidatus Avipropionibacterium avicola TaxID=2840701 RepID=A0A9D1GXJ8_9ACTN|nr:alcohol acetyltransferase [Candidatus Avipropionibacterium avicola]
MSQPWVRLDNASNIFLAARSDVDPKVFRLGAELDHTVDPVLLQQALDTTFDRYPLYHAVLRSGIFWYYLQSSDLRPVVTVEDQPTCAPIYQADRRTLLFRVTHHRRRINLEVFHALSDGAGALGFLTDLLTTYTRLHLAHPEPAEPPVSPESPPAARTLSADSFTHYFRRRRRPATAEDDSFGQAAAPATEGLADVPPEPRTRWKVGRLIRPTGAVHRVKGTRTPDNRTRAVELTMPAKDMLDLARAEGVSPTIYLTALFFEAVRRSSPDLGRARTMAASVPVNLRQFFPSTSARNFFATVRISHTYGEGADDLGTVCRRLEKQFAPKATPAALEKKLRRLIRFERSPALRIVPRPIKDFLLGLLNRANNRNLTVAVSNLGRVALPEPAAEHVRKVLFHVSAARPQFCAISHAGRLAITFTSPFCETDHVREFARMLTSHGISVTVAAARVTEEELAPEVEVAS